MTKNIIMCSDGTGNADIKGRGTNVFKLFEAVDLNGHRSHAELVPQIAFYDDGVGTQSFLPLRILGGAIGWGLSRNVRRLYRELSRVYDPGDRIFLFGFSRGAFTVRTLAGMITNCGLVDGTKIGSAHDLRKAVDEAYDAYRAGYDSVLTKLVSRLFGWKNRTKAVEVLKAKYPLHEKVKLEFIGVWDTVDAVGMPFAIGDLFNKVVYQFKFPTQTLNALVQKACHALSVDDERRSFKPVLWDEENEAPGRIEQVWFAGVHSNVGGGYPKQGMSLVALDWILFKAEERGLRLQPIDLAVFQGHATVDDKLYDPRAGLGIFYRWTPRDITRLCGRSHVTPMIHVTVAERIAHGTEDYAPGNLPAVPKIVYTPLKNSPDGLANRRAQEVEHVLREAHRHNGGEPLLSGVRRWIRLGDVAYWLFMSSWLVLIAGGIAFARALARGGPFPLLVCALFVAAGFILAWILSMAADSKMSDSFSRFWQREQQGLRAALKKARAVGTVEHQGVGSP